MKNGNTLVLGLTGPTGSGKTTVCETLRGMDIPIIDADQIAREVVSKGKHCLIDLVLEYSSEILNADGTLNRKKLGAMVFADRKKLVRLNQITLPYILQEVSEQIEAYRMDGQELVVLDAPTLFESRADQFCNKTAAVLAGSEKRRQRIMERDGLSEKEADDRIASQNSDDYYRTRVDYVLENDGGTAALRVQVAEMLDKLFPQLSFSSAGEENID